LGVEESGVLAKNPPKVPDAQDKHVVEALAT